MTYVANGATVSETELNALTTVPPQPPPLRRFTTDIYQSFTLPGEKGFLTGRRLLYPAGKIVPQTEIDALFKDATITGVSPATGPAAGGTDVTITGTNFAGVSGVTFGGTAATLVRVIDEQTLTCRTPAGTLGAKDVVVTDDSGPVTATGAFTYA